MRKLLENGKSVPDLGKYESVEQFLNGMSGSESEFDDSSEVTNPKSGFYFLSITVLTTVFQADR